MFPQRTSLEAFAKIKPTLNNRQKQVYNLLFANKKPLTNTEISTKLNIPINAIVPRVNELCHKKHLVRSFGRRPCEITGFNVMTWGLIEEQMEMGV